MALDNLGKDDIPGRLRQMAGKAKGDLMVVEHEMMCGFTSNDKLPRFTKLDSGPISKVKC